MHTGWRWRYSVGARPLPLKVAPIQRSVTSDFHLQSRRDSDCQMSELIWVALLSCRPSPFPSISYRHQIPSVPAGVLMNPVPLQGKHMWPCADRKCVWSTRPGHSHMPELTLWVWHCIEYKSPGLGLFWRWKKRWPAGCPEVWVGTYSDKPEQDIRENLGCV